MQRNEGIFFLYKKKKMKKRAREKRRETMQQSHLTAVTDERMLRGPHRLLDPVCRHSPE